MAPSANTKKRTRWNFCRNYGTKAFVTSRWNLWDFWPCVTTQASKVRIYLLTKVKRSAYYLISLKFFSVSFVAFIIYEIEIFPALLLVIPQGLITTYLSSKKFWPPLYNNHTKGRDVKFFRRQIGRDESLWLFFNFIVPVIFFIFV